MRAMEDPPILAWIPAFAGMTGTGDRDARFPPTQGSDGGGVDSWTHLALFGLVYSYGRGWK